MTQHLVALIADYGLLLVALCVMAEQIGLPVPAFPVLLVAGALAAAGRLPLAALVVVSLAAALACDLLWYWAGRRYGPHLLRGLCRISLSPDSCVHRSELRFERWGGGILVFAKFVPGLSLVAPPLAGALGLSLRTFLLLDGGGGLLWTAAGVGLGYAFAPAIGRLLDAVAATGRISLVVVVALFVLFAIWRWLRRRRLREALAVPRIDTAQLHAALAAAAPPLVVDVRSAVSRKLDPRIIRGARLADAEGIAAELGDVPRERNIVTYCNCPNEATSARAARTLLAHGYRNVHPLAGGLVAWAGAGLPIERADRDAGAAPGKPRPAASP